MKRNLFRTVALISMLSLGASSVVANEERITPEESIFTRKTAAQIWESLNKGAHLAGDALAAFYAEHKEQILNRALPAVVTVVAGVFLIKTWPTAAPVTTDANAETGQKDPTVTPTRKSTRNRTPSSKRGGGKAKAE